MEIYWLYNLVLENNILSYPCKLYTTWIIRENDLLKGNSQRIIHS